MFRNATQSVTILNELRNDIKDENKWISLANSQATPNSQIEILTRAVATVPGSLKLWTELINRKCNFNDHENLYETLRDALSLFSSNKDLWLIMFTMYPSIETFTTALRTLDNGIVWEYYLKFSMSGNLQPQQILSICSHYLNFEPKAAVTLIDKLLCTGHNEVAAELLIATECDFSIWDIVIKHNLNNTRLLETALHRFPSQGTLLLPVIAQQKFELSGFNEARNFLLQHLESASNTALFCKLFKALTAQYELQIEETMRNQGQGGWKTAQLLTEYSNILRKQPYLLNDAATREFPNNIGLWLDRAQLWIHRPHIAADIIETALRQIKPLDAVNGHISELYIRYAQLLAANGSGIQQACEPLESALAKGHTTKDNKAKIYRALADIQQGPGQNPSLALKTLETALEVIPGNSELWMHYISVLIETNSPNLLESFSRCCIQGVVTMRIVLMVAQALPAGSSNQMAVFDKGVSSFPVQIVLPLWKHYLITCNDAVNIFQLRALYQRAFETFTNYRRHLEELTVLYCNAEKSQRNGSMLIARKQILPIVSKSVNIDVWDSFVSTFDGDINGKRQAFDQAISHLNDHDANKMATKMAAFEEDLGEIDRARTLYQYASKLVYSPESMAAWEKFEEKNGFSGFHPDKIQFVSAVEMES